MRTRALEGEREFKVHDTVEFLVRLLSLLALVWVYNYTTVEVALCVLAHEVQRDFAEYTNEFLCSRHDFFYPARPENVKPK